MKGSELIEATGKWLVKLIETERLDVVLVSPNGSQHEVHSDHVAYNDGFLPVFLEAAEAVWEDATACGFGVQIGEDKSSLLGFSVEDMADVPFSVVALTMLHAIDAAREGDVLRLNALSVNAAKASARARYKASPSAVYADATQPGPSP